MQQSRPEPSLGQLFADLSQQMSTLVRQEVALATTELGQKAARVGRDIGFLALGGAVAYAGFLAIVGAFVLLLAIVMPGWLAALIVGVLVGAIGYVLVRKGLAALQREDLAPRQTIDTLKEDIAWAKDQTR
jgi:Putative Actinobacterial Holin-X, holin superfamily III